MSAMATSRESLAPALALALPLALLLGVSCVPQPRMCAAESECGGRASCVAGRCVAQGATAAIDNGRRLLFAPVDAAYVPRNPCCGDDGAGALDLATLGRTRDGGALALLRFDVRLPPEAALLEAYVLLERATDVDADPVLIDLHAARVVDPWDSASVTWARAPRLEEVGAPITRVSAGSGPLVRLEVRDLVQRWRRRGHDDFGVAVVADGTSATGVAFAWRARDAASAPVGTETKAETRPEAGPRLELYVR
jgi:hypothetical protein